MRYVPRTIFVDTDASEKAGGWGIPVARAPGSGYRVASSSGAPVPQAANVFPRLRFICYVCLIASVLLLASGCKRDDMADQPKYKAYEQSALFADNTSARPIPTGTVASGHLRLDERFYNGTENGKLVTAIPMPITEADLRRGQQEFNIYCAVCHGRLGEGNGMVVQRGFPHPPSYHIDRLRNAPIGHFYQVMSNGFGAMYSYDDKISPDDRWRIAAYIRALQLSQDALAPVGGSDSGNTSGGGQAR